MRLPGKVDPAEGGRVVRPLWRRVVRRALYVKLSLVALAVLAVGLALVRLVAGPVSLQSYNARVGEALAFRIGPGWSVALTDTEIRLRGITPAVRTTGLEIRNPNGVVVVRAPDATVTFDPMSLLSVALSPREIELRGLQLTAILGSNGSLAFVSEGGPGLPEAAAPALPALPPGDGRPDPSAVSQAVWSLLDPILRPTSLVGALDRAVVSDARLTLVGEDGRQRIAFSRVGATFEREAAGGRRMNIRLESPRGAWALSGEALETGTTRSADLEAADVPLDDILLLAGLSGLPQGSDLKLSGRVAAVLEDGRLAKLEGRFTSAPGTVTPPGQPPLRIERLSGVARWDEGARRIDFSDLALAVGKASTILSGSVLPGADGSWRLQVSGRDSLLAGARHADPEIRIPDVRAEAVVAPTGIVVDRVGLKGEELDVTIRGAVVPLPDGTGMRATVEAQDTSVRRFLAIWPTTVNPELRGYLATNLKAGTLKTMRLETDLDPADLRSAFSGKPISDRALRLAFAMADAQLTVIEGLPPLRRLAVEGGATGTTTTLAARQGRIEMPDGRRLVFSDGTYSQVDEHLPGSAAKIAFRLEGGADAVASLLRSPIFRELGSFDIDPAAVKGKADLKVGLSLVVHHIPPVSEIPITVTGGFSDVAMDKVFGREKLEGAQVSVAYERGALSIRGDGRLGGSPAQFDLRQPRTGPGEVLVNLTLDEAARARRSLPAAPQVVGPVAVKIAAPFGPGAKGPTRVEADLSKTAIDGLLPGWAKPAGRPGRLAFVLPEGESSDLRDVQLESGPVQLRGHVVLGTDGAFDKAELSTFKLSPGDDMRAQVDRTGGTYKIVLRGNVGDARPVLKWLTGSGPSPGGAGGKGRDPPDVDVDAAVNIVTGNNDEALTGVTAKISSRGRDLRALQLRGQFRQAVVEASLARRDGSPPTLTLRSGDAGATLRFLDLYRRMAGGELAVQTSLGDTQAGTIAIDSFALKNEPALRRIVAQNVTTTSGSDDRAGTTGSKLTPDQVDFVKLTAEFRKTASRVDYKDVVVWGPQVGFNLSGYVDYPRDRTDILGTFVPAYGLNNAFSQVPIVGPILGGGSNEGLFAIDFRISGQASAPTLTVNPLTAVAPGILRKLFGWMMPEEEATGATVPPEGERPARAARPRAR